MSAPLRRVPEPSGSLGPTAAVVEDCFRAIRIDPFARHEPSGESPLAVISYIAAPPSTTSAEPVKAAASAETANRTARATSSGVIRRPIGVEATREA